MFETFKPLSLSYYSPDFYQSSIKMIAYKHNIAFMIIIKHLFTIVSFGIAY